MKAVIVLGGDPPSAALLRREAAQADVVLCADKGAQYALAAGVTPTMVLGDMDSLGDAARRLACLGVPMVRHPAEKDETDGQLAVDKAVELGATQAVLLGGFGQRLDHTLGNLMLLIRLEKRGVAATMHDDRTQARAACGDTVLCGSAGDILSVLPFGDTVQAGPTENLKYVLPQPTHLPADATIGISNVMAADTCRVGIRGGWAFLLRTRQQ
ncbi:MAG: thiamine diphosphokinase [Eubacteriales bacterium]|nr:thiamine diphosphokinase [Eubacteriales bacterium]